MLVSPTYFNKTSDNNKLGIKVFSNDVDVIHPSTKVLVLTQSDIFGLISVTVDNTYRVYEEVIDNNDDNKELNQVMDMFAKCGTNAPTSASRVHYNSSSNSKPQQEQYQHQRTSSGQGDYYSVEVLTDIAPGEPFNTILGGRSYAVECPLNMGRDCVDRVVRTSIFELGVQDQKYR